MKDNYKLLVSVIFYGVLLFMACNDKYICNPNKPKNKEITQENDYDFATTQMNCEAKGKTLFEVYGENLFADQNKHWVKKGNLIALENSYPLDEGSYSMKLLLPRSIE